MDLPPTIKELENNGRLFWECNLCKKQFTHYYSAKRHTQNKNRCDVNVSYTCLSCGKLFHDKTKYTKHTETIKCKTIYEEIKDKNVSVQTDIIINDLWEEGFKIFMTNSQYNFWKYIYLPININDIDSVNYDISNKNYLLIENCLKFIYQLEDSDIHTFYSFILRKLKHLDQDKIYIFYSIVKKNIDLLRNKTQIGIWNDRIFQELISDIVKKNLPEVDFN